MSDGISLSAKIWLPVVSSDIALPAILEIIPYRKRDAYAMRDHSNHAWLAAKGYVCVRPDMRGHGDSEGLMTDEYSIQEQKDTVEVIEWVARQHWCDGNVGMIGLSWGGIASMQAAIRQPAALKAIVPVGSSVDRYYDDGGYLLGGYPGQGLGWGSVMFGYCTRPPDPAVVGKNWRKMWFQRLENTPMFAEKWLTHQTRDETWKQGSVCEHYDKIKVPVLGISGWNDCWPNTMIRLLDNIQAPCRVVSGPWAHVYPNLGGPGPKIGFLQLVKDWFDYWLKGVNNGVMDCPKFLAYIQDSHKPEPSPNDRTGRWIGEKDWPSPYVKTELYSLQPGSLFKGKIGKGKVTICSPLSLGLATGEYMPISGVRELPQDQSIDDSNSVYFDTPPLKGDLNILGTSRVHLNLSCDKSCGVIAARLCDVGPDGASTLISFGVLNLKQRKGREVSAEVSPDEDMDLVVRLNDTGWSLKSGHRLRLALSSQLWPMAWPVSETATLSLNLSSCCLELPIREKVEDSEIKAPFEPPVFANPIPHEVIKPVTGTREINHCNESGEVTYSVSADSGKIWLKDANIIYGATNSQHYFITDGNALSPRIEYRSEFNFERDKWNVRTESALSTSCDAHNFFLKGHIFAYEGSKKVFTRFWDVSIPRTVF